MIKWKCPNISLRFNIPMQMMCVCVCVWLCVCVWTGLWSRIFYLKNFPQWIKYPGSVQSSAHNPPWSYWAIPDRIYNTIRYRWTRVPEPVDKTSWKTDNKWSYPHIVGQTEGVIWRKRERYNNRGGPPAHFLLKSLHYPEGSIGCFVIL